MIEKQSGTLLSSHGPLLHIQPQELATKVSTVPRREGVCAQSDGGLSLGLPLGLSRPALDCGWPFVSGLPSL